jgi:putative hydrolase of the HAD superfamily
MTSGGGGVAGFVADCAELRVDELVAAAERLLQYGSSLTCPGFPFAGLAVAQQAVRALSKRVPVRYIPASMVKAVIFDLDSCLAAADEVGRELFARAFDAIRAANHGHVPEDQLAAAFNDCWRIPFDVISERYGFSPAMRAVGFAAFAQTEVTQQMHGYGDLDVLRHIRAHLFLVTSGFRRLQLSKVKALGKEHLLTELHIDAIDEEGPKGKRHAFESILRKYQFAPSEVLVVGDNPDSEIAAGNSLGITTVQTLRPGVPASPVATHQIRTLHELLPLL